MSDWVNKRFWKQTDVVEEAGGWTVQLDGRGVKTPGKSPLILPTELMAVKVAQEFEAQEDVIDPTSMPWTRSANSAIEKVATQRVEVEAHLISYAGTDLLSYRAERPDSLIARQAEGWDPILDWMEDRFGVRLAVVAGIMPTEQNPAVLTRLAEEMSPMSDFALTGFHDMVTLTGSYSLGIALAEKQLEADSAWALSRVDEIWQIEQWGEDEEAAEEAKLKSEALVHATEFFRNA